jgi:hypothetical protein
MSTLGSDKGNGGDPETVAAVFFNRESAAHAVYFGTYSATAATARRAQGAFEKLESFSFVFFSRRTKLE